MNGLKYHYSNPRFDGLPWPADRSAKSRKPCCVKKPYSQPEAQRECDGLRKTARAFRWFPEFCRACNAFHVKRKRR